MIDRDTIFRLYLDDLAVEREHGEHDGDAAPGFVRAGLDPDAASAVARSIAEALHTGVAEEIEAGEIRALDLAAAAAETALRVGALLGRAGIQEDAGS